MSRSVFFCLLLVIAIIVFAAPKEGMAICKWADSLEVSTDTQLSWPHFSSWYDPCDNWITWAFIFYRTSQTGNDNTLNMGVEGTSVGRAYPSGDYSYGYHEFTNTEYCGSSTAHRIFMNLFNPNVTGNFLNMKARAIYSAGNAN